MNDVRLQRVIDAISDGERIDWASVRQQLVDRDAVDYCAHLETVSKISAVSHDSDGPQRDVRESRWVSILLAFALVQIVLGIMGAIAYQSYSFLNALRLLTILSFSGMGIVLRHSRYNLRARHLGAVFVLCALGFGRVPYARLFDAWFPESTVSDILRNGVALDAWAPYFFWQFARRFPTTARFTLIDRTAIAITPLAAVIGTALFVLNFWAAAAETAPAIAAAFAVEQPGVAGSRYYSATIFLLSLPVLPIIFFRARSSSADERARVRLFALAMMIGIAPTYIEVILEAALPSYTAFLRVSPVALNVVIGSVILPLLALPLVTGYSVLVHRLLDVRLLVRYGVRYLLAKWTLVVLTLAPFGLLVWHVYAHRTESVASVLSDRTGLLLVGLSAVGCVLIAGKDVLMTMLDRWFDRRGVDRSTVLARAGDALRLVRGRSELVASVDDATRSALNAHAFVYFYDSRRNTYAPFGRGGLSLHGDSALATILVQEPTRSTLGTDGERSIARFLPRPEQLWLAETNACVLTPIRSGGVERPAGLIAFGPRRDALGYSPDDERFVTALASAAGMSLENLRLKSGAGDDSGGDFGMLCRRCQRVSDPGEERLSCECGGELQPASVPRRINNKFQVEALLGAGGMGVAYLASDLDLNRLVAIKTMPFVSADAMARLRREAQTMAALSHANLATILGLESWRGTPILVCEYLAGGTLQQRLTRGRMDVAQALALGITLLDALEYMHAQGMLHRDIKPSNIAFSSDGTPKLLDFGLTGMMEHAESTTGADTLRTAPLLGTKLTGTVAYLPPQAFQGEVPTIRFDLWALAVVLFEAITGHHPFAEGEDTPQNICRGRFVARVEPGASGAPAAILQNALSPHIHRQFESCAAMRKSLVELSAAFRS